MFPPEQILVAGIIRCQPAQRGQSGCDNLSAMMRNVTLLLCLLALAACEVQVNNEPEIEYLQMPGSEALDLPFSAAVRVDNMLYVSGNIGNIPGTLELAEGGIQGETRQTLDNIQRVVEQFGSSMDRVVKCTVFLADMAEWGAMNEVYRTYFDNPPARSALGASGLALDARVEIECIAVTD
jgi:reactive intermediate/imine deaminase